MAPSVFSLARHLLGHDLVHARGFRGEHGHGQHALAGQVRVDAIGGVEDVGVGGSELPENAGDARGLIQMACRVVDLDQFHAGLNAELFLLQLRERLLQIGLGGGGLAQPLFGEAEQRLNFPKSWGEV